MNANVSVCLPSHGNGWTTFHRGQHGENQYGTEQTIGKVLKVAYYWYLLHPDRPIQVGHISKQQGGPFPPHDTHAHGLDVDIRPMRDDGLNLPVSVFESAYSWLLTQELLRLLDKVGKPRLVLFNGPESLNSGLSYPGPRHHDHVHIRF